MLFRSHRSRRNNRQRPKTNLGQARISSTRRTGKASVSVSSSASPSPPCPKHQQCRVGEKANRQEKPKEVPLRELRLRSVGVEGLLRALVLQVRRIALVPTRINIHDRLENVKQFGGVVLYEDANELELLLCPRPLVEPLLPSVFFLLGLEHRMLKILQGEEVSYVIYPFEHSPSFVFQRLDLPESSEFIKKAAKDIIAGKVNPPRLRKKDE